MKKLFTLVIVSLCMQAAEAQVRFGVKAGYNRTAAEVETDLYFYRDMNYQPVNGFHAGVTSDIAIGAHFAVQPSLLYVFSGFDNSGQVPGPLDDAAFMNAETRYHHLELPVNLLYKYSLGPGKLFVGAGPWASYGIGGRMKTTTEYRGATSHLVYDIFFLDKGERYYNPYSQQRKRYVRPFNFGAGFTLGYEFTAGITLSANYNLGLTDVEPMINISQKSRSAGVSIGYLFK